MKILIIIEHDNKNLKTSNLHILSAAKQLGEEIDGLIVGYNLDDHLFKSKTLSHLKKLYVADAPEFEHQLAENMAQLIQKVANNYDFILTGANTFGKNLMPRVAALLDVAMISDVTQIISADTFIRPIYAGNAMALIKSQDKIKIISIRTTAFSSIEEVPIAEMNIEKITEPFPNQLSQFVNQELNVSARPELTDARVVVSGGRGLKSAENFKKLEQFADSLGAALGASRAAVDAGFAPNDYQVGQTGKVVAPELYIAVGISGAIQHIAGMKDSKVIVAINSDPDAPIFQIADYGLVGDLFKILPELQNELNQPIKDV